MTFRLFLLVLLLFISAPTTSYIF